MPGRTEGSSSAAPRPLDPPMPCRFHQGSTRPAWQGNCLGSGSGSLGLWALNQLPAMQGEVFGPPFGQSREALPPSPCPLGGGPKVPSQVPNKHRTLP